MTPNYPYFGLPNYVHYMNPSFYPQRLSNNSRRSFKSTTTNRESHNKTINSNANNLSTNATNFSRKKMINEDYSSSQDTPIFSLLGINLYFDDILILCILFFLYNENVNDPFLFIVLILLLLT